MGRAAIINAPLPQRRYHPPAFEIGEGLRPAVPAYGLIPVEAAQQYPPSRSARQPQDSQVPAEIGRVTYGSLQSEKESLEFTEVVVLVVADIGDVDVPRSGCNRFHIGRLVSVVAGRQRAIKATARHGGERDKPLVRFGERAGGKDGDRR